MIKINKIRAKADFDRVFKFGKVHRGSFLSVRYLSASGDGSVGVVVSTKVSKKAVIRNKIRRRILEIIRSQSEDFPKNNNLVIVVSPKAAETSFTKLREDLLKTIFKTKSNYDS